MVTSLKIVITFPIPIVRYLEKETISVQQLSRLFSTHILLLYYKDFFSELEKDDMERTHMMSVNNGLGTTNYTFQIPNIEGNKINVLES